MKVSNLNSTHLGGEWAIDAPQYPDQLQGEITRIEHFVPAKGVINFSAIIRDEDTEEEHRTVLSVKTVKATSLWIGGTGITVASDTTIYPVIGGYYDE